MGRKGQIATDESDKFHQMPPTAQSTERSKGSDVTNFFHNGEKRLDHLDVHGSTKKDTRTVRLPPMRRWTASTKPHASRRGFWLVMGSSPSKELRSWTAQRSALADLSLRMKVRCGGGSLNEAPADFYGGWKVGTSSLPSLCTNRGEIFNVH
eukprot:GEMP01086690.1.p1 GENE.GEMP01086690.1~~GEMP01086690.1.p1  ORF type:complete len:152 (+),score=20.40 GEMP01086690.1:354-809(+)